MAAGPSSQGQWALPGGFVDEGEPLDHAAARELQEETSVNPRDVLLEQVRLQEQHLCVSPIPNLSLATAQL